MILDTEVLDEHSPATTSLSVEQAAVIAVSGLAALQGLRAGRIAAEQRF